MQVVLDSTGPHVCTIPIDQYICIKYRYCLRISKMHTQSRIIGAVRGAHSQLWETTLPVFSPYALRKYDMRFGTPAII